MPAAPTHLDQLVREAAIIAATSTFRDAKVRRAIVDEALTSPVHHLSAECSGMVLKSLIGREILEVVLPEAQGMRVVCSASRAELDARASRALAATTSFDW